MFCHKCGKKLHNKAEYCSFCGEAVIKHTQEDNKSEAREGNEIEIDNSISMKAKENSSFSGYSNGNGENTDKLSGIKEKIFNVMSFIITLIFFAIASAIGKSIVHDSSFMRILQYIVPGLLTGVLCAIIVIFINSKLYSNKVRYKWACVLICALVGALFGIYGAILVSVLFGVIMYFISK